MIYREQKLKEVTLVNGDICKECTLEDCIIPEGVHLENCMVVDTEEKTAVLTHECESCGEEPCEDCEE